MGETGPMFKERLTGIKNDDGKLRWSLLPFRELESVVGVLEHGARKYSIDNWKEINDAERRYFDAAMRHLISFRNGELEDKESGSPHLSHAICCLLFLLWHST